MQDEMTPENAAKLREPFPPQLVSKLPKAGLMLDYVGHAATTDRLLQVDPSWTWVPMAVDADGAPIFDEHGGLWIWLTVCGVRRPGYGEPGRIGPKEAIGDAIRNAAMRFGVALDLWAKEDLRFATPVSDADKKALVQLFMRKGGKTELEAAAWLASMGEKADSMAWVEQTRNALLEKPDAAKNPEPELPVEPSTVSDDDTGVMSVPF